MSKREFTNINGIQVCDQTARDNIPTNLSQLTNDANYATETFVTNKIAEASLSGGNVDLSGYVTNTTGNANQITFADGQSFQAKRPKVIRAIKVIEENKDLKVFKDLKVILVLVEVVV